MATVRGSNTLFWLSFAAVSYTVARALSWQLQEALYQRRINMLSSPDALDRDDKSRSASPEPSSERKKPGSEDDLSVATLEILSYHPNYDIRQAARKVALHRFVRDKECCTRLRRDLHDSDKAVEATAVLRSLMAKVDLSILIDPKMTGIAEDFADFADDLLDSTGILNRRTSTAGDDPVFDRLFERQGPMLTLEEIEGENGEIVSVRVPSVNVGGDAGIGENGPDDLELRRWQRREAMVVQLDAVENDYYEENDEMDDESYAYQGDQVGARDVD